MPEASYFIESSRAVALLQSLGGRDKLQASTVPDALLQTGVTTTDRAPRHADGETIEAIERNAQWIEDEDLKAAMLSLAKSLKRSRE